mgnify:CR=1 FL=1
MTRKCFKCGDKLVVNEKLNYMECVGGVHIEPINTNRPQWWNQCPECDTMGLNEAIQERFTQRFGEDGQPVFVETEKGLSIVFDEKNPESITCRACGYTFKK